MSRQSTRKVQITIGFTERQLSILQAEAKRVDISPADQIRRVLDEWIDKIRPAQRTSDPRAQSMYPVR